VDIDAELNAAPWMPSVTRTGDMTMLLQIAARDIRQLTDKTACSYARAESCRPAGIDHPAGVASWPRGRSEITSTACGASFAARKQAYGGNTARSPTAWLPDLGRVGLSAATATRGGTPAPGAGRANGPVPQPWIWNASLGMPDGTSGTARRPCRIPIRNTCSGAMSEQRLAVDCGNTRAPARRPGGRAGWEPRYPSPETRLNPTSQRD
jgi:hypothetical protein